MTSRFAIVAMLLLVFAATPAFACKVCDGNGCKDAKPTETGRSKCTATTTTCTISGSTCLSNGCECGMMGCEPCDATCFETPFGAEHWELASVQVIPAARDASASDWILVDVRTIPAAVR